MSEDTVKIPLRHNEGGFLETLWESLSHRVSIEKAQEVILDIRDSVNSDVDREAELKSLHSRIKNCTKCTDVSHTPKMPMWNLHNPDVLFIVDSPSIPESGVKLFIQTLKENDFSASQCALTYVNRCPSKSSDHKYSKESISKCSWYLFSEIELLRPKLIVALGVGPGSIMCGADIKIMDERNKIIWINNWPIIITYSPAYVSKSNSNLVTNNFKQDFKTIHTFIHGK